MNDRDEYISPAEWRALILDIIKELRDQVDKTECILRDEIKEVKGDLGGLKLGVKDLRVEISDLKDNENQFRSQIIEKMMCGDHAVEKDIVAIKATDEALKSAKVDGRNLGAIIGTILTTGAAIILKIFGIL